MGENIERKTSKCPFCGDEVDLFIFYNGKIVGCKHCGVHITKQTNADRIRSMTDEELAKMLNRSCPIGMEADESCFYSDDTKCIQCWLDWLQEAQE